MKKAQHGFSLVELMLMLTVIGILSGVAVASLNGLTSSQQDVAAARVRSAVIHAQLWAISTGDSTWVQFDAGSDLVRLYCEDEGNPGKANRVAMLDPLTRSAMEIHLGNDSSGITSVDFDTTAEVQFDAQGLPYDADGALLTSDGVVGFTGGATLRVTRNTGYIKLD
ncbi:MAG: pilus assembly FimT family protein [Planctomycetota bacterium]